MARWTFLTNHARVLVCIARDPGVRIRDIAATVGITERRAFGIVDELAAAGYVVKKKDETDSRRNLYHVQSHLPLRESSDGARSIGEVLDLLAGADQDDGQRDPATAPGSPGPKAARRVKG